MLFHVRKSLVKFVTVCDMLVQFNTGLLMLVYVR